MRLEEMRRGGRKHETDRKAGGDGERDAEA